MYTLRKIVSFSFLLLLTSVVFGMRPIKHVKINKAIRKIKEKINKRIVNPDSCIYLYRYSPNGKYLGFVSITPKAEDSVTNITSRFNLTFDEIKNHISSIFQKLTDKNFEYQAFLFQHTTLLGNMKAILPELKKHFHINFTLFNTKTGKQKLRKNNSSQLFFIFSKDSRFLANENYIYNLEKQIAPELIIDQSKFKSHKIYLYEFSQHGSFFICLEINYFGNDCICWLKGYNTHTSIIDGTKLLEYSLSKDEQYIAVRDFNKSLVLLKTNPKNRTHNLEKLPIPEVNTPNYEFSQPKSNYIGVLCNQGGDFVLYDVKTKEKVLTIPNTTGFEFSSHSGYLAVHTTDKTLHIINTSKNLETKKIENIDLFYGFTPDGKKLYCIEQEKNKKNEINGKETLHFIDAESLKTKVSIEDIGSHEFSPDGKLLLFLKHNRETLEEEEEEEETNIYYLQKILDIEDTKAQYIIGQDNVTSYEFDSNNKLHLVVKTPNNVTEKERLKSYEMPTRNVRGLHKNLSKVTKTKKYSDMLIIAKN